MTLSARKKPHLDNSTKSADVHTPTPAEFLIDRENRLPALGGAAPREKAFPAGGAGRSRCNSGHGILPPLVKSFDVYGPKSSLFVNSQCFFFFFHLHLYFTIYLFFAHSD